MAPKNLGTVCKADLPLERYQVTLSRAENPSRIFWASVKVAKSRTCLVRYIVYEKLGLAKGVRAGAHRLGHAAT